MGTISNCHCKDPYKPIRGFKGSWRLSQGFGSRALILKVLSIALYGPFFFWGGDRSDSSRVDFQVPLKKMFGVCIRCVSKFGSMQNWLVVSNILLFSPRSLGK